MAEKALLRYRRGNLCPAFQRRIGLVCLANRVPGDAASAYQPVKQWPRFSRGVGERKAGVNCPWNASAEDWYYGMNTVKGL